MRGHRKDLEVVAKREIWIDVWWLLKAPVLLHKSDILEYRYMRLACMLPLFQSSVKPKNAIAMQAFMRIIIYPKENPPRVVVKDEINQN